MNKIGHNGVKFKTTQVESKTRHINYYIVINFLYIPCCFRTSGQNVCFVLCESRSGRGQLTAQVFEVYEDDLYPGFQVLLLAITSI